MKCRRAKTLICDFIDGMIGDQDRAALEQHLTQCKSCEEMATGLSRSLDLLHRVEPVQPDENFTWKVRLRIARERNAMADVGAEQGVWIRSWNRRFAFSALSTFVVIVLAGSIAINSALFSDQPPTTANNEETRLPFFANKSETVAEPKLNSPVTPSAPMYRWGSVDPSLVSSGGERSRQAGKASGPIASDEVADLDLESLMRQYAQSQAKDYRMRQLQDQVDLLTAELSDCRVLCSESEADNPALRR